MHSNIEPEDLEVNLTHLADIPKWQTEKPYQVDIKDLGAEFPRTNCEYTEHRVKLCDVRTSKRDFRLETTGFVYLRHSSNFLPRLDQLQEHDQTAAFAPYLKETMMLVERYTEAEKVIAIDWRYRDGSNESQKAAAWKKETRRIVAQQPFHMVHSDYSIASGKPRIEAFLTKDEWNSYNTEEWRMRMINVWRPLLPVIEDSPLAFCDRVSVKKTDIIPYDKIVEDRDAENAYLLCKEDHQWYWMPHQRLDEPAMFVVWDSLDLEDENSTKVGMVPHSAFHNSTAETDAPPRQSFETQFIVITRRS